MDPGYIYAVVKEVKIGDRTEIVTVGGLPMVKIGKTKDPKTRHEEPIRQSSTWHPESFRCIELKKVKDMESAEKKLHTFFKEDNIIPAYEKGGIEWFSVSLDRVKMLFDALPKPPVFQHKTASISKDLLREFMKTTTIEKYDDDRPEHYPSIQDIRDGYFGEEYTDIAMFTPVARR